MPRAVVLGTSQDGGFPQGACECANCRWAQASGARRLVACLGIESDGAKYLIDATPDAGEQMRRFGARGRKGIAGILLTHAHAGHYTGLLSFGREAACAQDLPVYATAAMLRFLGANSPWKELFSWGHLTPRPVEPGIPLSLGDIRAVPFRVEHRGEFSDTVGYDLRGPSGRLVYVPDIDRWDAFAPPEPLGPRDTLLADGTFFDPGEIPGRDLTQVPHPLMTSTLDRFRGTTQLVFTHLNHSNAAMRPDSPARARIAAAGARVADDGESFAL